MSFVNIKHIIILQCFAILAYANLEGPFVFWGPKELLGYKKPALNSLEQDDLIDIYNNQAAIVVFNIQDSAFFLNRENYPRLRKLLESKTVLLLPQDFLDVHPEYVNNETQVITVQGPSSEQDAEITEKFDRLEDIYGDGKVLAILGSSSPEEEPIDEDLDSSDKNYVRERREATPEPKEAAEEVVYNAQGKALLYSADFPVLRFTSNENNSVNVDYKLRNLLSVSVDQRDQYSRLIVSFTTGSEKEKIILRFRFPENKSGYWSIGPVEVSHHGREWILNPPTTEDFLGAPKGFSFACAEPMVFRNGSVTLTFQEIQVQPLLNGKTKFGSAYNCVGFTTIPIWSGLLVSFILLTGITIGLYMMSEIKTMDRFENIKGKTLSFTVID